MRVQGIEINSFFLFLAKLSLSHLILYWHLYLEIRDGWATAATASSVGVRKGQVNNCRAISGIN